jgi:hypothetical protein
MSYDGIQEHDLPLKLRLMNLLWNLGWFVRPNVKLARYQEGRKTKDQFTDIDVLAYRLLPLQDRITAVSSAKSGKESDYSEVFWLSGVKSYFGASLAYYIRFQASVLKTKPLCDKLGIITLNEDQLAILERRFFGPREVTSYMNLENYVRMFEYFTELKNVKPRMHSYITERFWIDSSSNQLLKLITALQDLTGLPLGNKSKLFFKYYLSSLLALPVQDLCHQLSRIPSLTIESELETTLMGGEQAREEKQRTIQACKSFASTLIETQKLNISKLEIEHVFEDISDLPYFKHLADLISNMVQSYRYSVFTPRILDAAFLQIVKKSEDVIPDLRLVTLPDLEKHDWEYAIKATRDILLFVHRLGVFGDQEIKMA